MRPTGVFAGIVLALVLAGCHAGVGGRDNAGGKLGAPDHVVPSWYAGVPVQMHSYQTQARTPNDPPVDPAVMRAFKAAERFPVYITAPITEGSPFSHERPVKTYDGRDVTIPSHQGTLTRMPPSDKPARGIGYFVLPGPAASPDTVRAAERPKNSWASGPLAREILIGSEWTPLNSHYAVQYGLRTGLLKLEFFDGSALMWAEFSDPAVRCDATCGQVADLPALPAPPAGVSK